MSIPITFLEAAMGRLVKKFTPTGKISYPKARTVTSHTYETAPTLEGLRQRFDLIKKHAALGHALHQGAFTRPLVNESRAKMTDQDQLMHTLTIDIDGLDISSLHLNGLNINGKKVTEIDITQLDLSTVQFSLPDELNTETLKAISESVIKHLPPLLHNVTYMAHASSSFGTDSSKISLHLDFMLSQGVNPTMLKLWLTKLNFDCKAFEERLMLSNSHNALSWIIDPTLAQLARIVYIAPPEFDNVPNPFSNDEDRWIMVEKNQVSVDLRGPISKANPEGISNLINKRVNKLRKIEGLPAYKPKTKNLKNKDGTITKVVTNPGEKMIQIVEVNDGYARLNVNGGDSGGYYVKLDSPEIVRNFKGEEPFELAAANEEAYNRLCEEYQEEIITHSKSIPFIFRDELTDTHFSMMYDPKLDVIERDDEGKLSLHKIAKINLPDFMAERGKPMPPAIPQRHLIFDPTSTQVMGHKIINQYVAPTHVRKPLKVFVQDEALNYTVGEDNPHIRAALEALCPRSYKLMWHVLGSDKESFNHFINWLSFVVQRRVVSNTAWVISGVPGTGKGRLRTLILQHLVGSQYARHITMKNLLDNYNAKMAKTLLYTVDEFRLTSARNHVELLDTIKNYISEEQNELRAMYSEAESQNLYCNWMFFSNHEDVIKVEPKDRRFNIAKPQRMSLFEAYPEFEDDDELEKIKDELQQLAGFFMAFNVNERAARKPLYNKAKENMEVISLSISEKFARSLRVGDLDFILENACVRSDYLERDDQLNYTRAMNVIDPWASAANAGVRMEVELTDLQTVFKAINPDQKFKSIESFRKMLETNQVNVESRIKLGRRVPLVEIEWKARDSDIGEMIEKGLLTRNGANLNGVATQEWTHAEPPKGTH